MDRGLGRALLGGAAIVAALAVLGFALPRTMVVERSDEIAAPPATVYELLTDLRAARRWSPWRDARSQYLFAGPVTGQGARMEWSGRSRGRYEVEAAKPYSAVVLKVGLDGRTRTAAFRLTPSAVGVRVSWRMESDAGNDPLARWDNLLFRWRMGADLERGLERLGDAAESLPHIDMAAFDVRLVKGPARPVALLGGETDQTPQAVVAALTRSSAEVRRRLRRAGVSHEGGPVWTAERGSEDGRLRYRAGYRLLVPPTSADSSSGHPPSAIPGLELGRTPGGTVIQAARAGALEAAPQAEAAARLFRGLHQLAPAGPTWVEFSADPAETPPEALTVTVLLPVSLPGQ